MDSPQGDSMTHYDIGIIVLSLAFLGFIAYMMIDA